ncbi:MAG: family 78 glycoside hydrolase catalytic domain, partial [Clostridiales bacterium]|nr:family 78 glycoside hydrolase catalytic domain [Candidatus Blautia equi]
VRGQKVIFRFAEMLYPDSPEYENLKGMLMIENLRAAIVTDQFLLRDGEQVLEPHFTFHGYRYIEISGLDEALPLADVKGIALSSVPVLAADYKTSNPEVNKLWENVTWSLRDNFISIPTDCPQRNERMGWSGDFSVFSRSAVYMADSASFIRRHMMAVRDTQTDAGRFPDIAPVGNGFGGVLWGSVGLTAAWESFLQYNDEDMLRAEYPAMVRYMDYLDTRVNAETGLIDEGPLGDWLGPEYSLNEPAFLWMAYHAYDLSIVSKAAEILGYMEDAKKFAEKYEAKKQEFCQIFIDPDTHRTVFSSEQAMMANRHAPMMAPTALSVPKKLAGGKYLMDTQTSYAVPLALGILDGAYKEDAARCLAEAVERENYDNDNVKRPAYSLMTGFIGTAWIAPALSMNDKVTHAYRLLQNGEYPSWIYPVRQGATTIWERLNSYTLENGFGGNNGMNSFNHYSFGAVAAWMCMHSLGIMREEAHPGLNEFTLCPETDPTGQMTSAEGFVETVNGKVVSSWKKTDTGYEYHFEIPANTTANLVLPGIRKTLGSGIYEIREGEPT